MDPVDNKSSDHDLEQSVVGNLGALGWQATRTSIRDRLGHMLMSGMFADIFFLFRESNGAVHRIPAHKLVLSIGSAVFEAMFRFNDADRASSNSLRELEIVDVEPGAFKALLTFLYTDDIQAINEDSVMSILYTAKKYAVPAIEAACVSFIKNCVSSENAFMLLSKAHFYDEKHLADKCLEIIDEDAQEAMKSEDFLAIDHETLCMVLARNTLRVKELTLFNAAIRWALEACRTRKFPTTAENQRLVLGSALHQIRFPLMSPIDFAKHVVPSQLLLDSEMLSVFLHHHTGNEQPTPFPSSYRGLYTPEMVVKRFQQISESSWNYSSGIPDRIIFEVDTPIFILGFGLYGSRQESYQHSAHIEILNSDTGELLASNKCSFDSDGSPATFSVMFKEPVEICPNTAYLAWSRLTGVDTYYGKEGLHRIKLERDGRPDIIWHFQDAPEISIYGTSAEKGQIPEIIFCPKHNY